MLGPGARKLKDMSDEEFGRAVGDDSLVPDLKFKRNEVIHTTRADLDHPGNYSGDIYENPPEDDYRQSVLRGASPKIVIKDETWKLSEELSKFLGVVRRKPALSKKLQKFIDTGDYRW